MKPSPKILLLEPSFDVAQRVRALLANDRDFSGAAVCHQAAAEPAGESGPWDLIIADYVSFFAAFEANGPQWSRRPAVLLYEHEPEMPVQAVFRGLHEIVHKSRLEALVPALRRLTEIEAYTGDLAGHQTLLEKFDDVLVIEDHVGRLVYWSRRAETLFGWSPKDAQMRTIEDMLPTASLTLQEGRNLARQAGVWRGTIEIFTRAGEPRTISLRRTLLTADWGPFGQTLVFGDQTRQHELEEQLMTAQRMGNLGLLSAGIAHDLNNVLAPVLMAVGVMRSSEKVEPDLLNMVERSVNQGAKMLRQMLSFARGSDGERKELAIGAVVHDVVEMARRSLPETIALETKLRQNLPEISGNETELQQVFLNLLLNSRDAMPNGGKLQIAIDRVALGPEAARAIDHGRPGNFIAVEITDTGSGIQPPLLKRIWEPFFTSKGPHGTGLGLFIVRRIILEHGGFVAVRTQVDRGTTFVVHLPIGSRSVESAGEDLSLSTKPAILLVDDDARVRWGVSALLQKHSYRVIAVAGAAEAAAAIDAHCQDIGLIISDGVFDGPGGDKLLRAVGRRCLPILSISSAPPERLLDPSALAGPHQTLAKPFTQEQLLLAVGTLLPSKAA